MRAPYFFLAYAHTGERPWVVKLYQEICREIVERTDWPTEWPPGFMDQTDIESGEDWREAVAVGLASCRVMVPLYSPRYFTREQCGFEWHGFTRRVLDHRARSGTDGTAIVPALWTPVPDLAIPEAVRHVQVDFSVAPHYEAEGLYTLIKNRAYRTSYQRVVTHLAMQIIRAAEKSGLTPCPAHEVDLSRDAFRTSPQDVPADRRLTVMVAAPTISRLPLERQTDFYGGSPASWVPYRPDSARPIAEVVAGIARALDYEPTIVTLEQGMAQRDWTSPESEIGIILFDPWLALDSSFSAHIRRIDELGGDRIGTIMLWNMRDEQTLTKAEEILKALQAIAPRMAGDGGIPAELGAIRVHSLEELRQRVPGVLGRAQNRYFDHAPANPPLGGAAMIQPQLSRPEDGTAGSRRPA